MAYIANVEIDSNFIRRNTAKPASQLPPKVRSNCSFLGRIPLIFAKCYLRGVLLSFGLECGWKLPRIVTICVRLYWIACFLPFTIAQLNAASKLFWRETEMFSSTELSMSVNSVVSLTVAFQILILFLAHKKTLEDLLESEPHDATPILLIFLINVPYEVSLIAQALYVKDSSFLTVDSYLTSQVWRSLPAFMLCYVRLIRVIQLRQQRILHELEKPMTQMNIDSIISQKWALRGVTELVNNFSGSTLLMYYVKFFICIINVAGNLFCFSFAESPVSYRIMAYSSYFLAIFLIAHQGSRLVSLCTAAHQKASRLSEDALNEKELRKLRRVLKFRKKWDCLSMSAGFTIEMPVVVTFFGACVTVVAISLQFDYRVVGKLAEASAMARKL